MVRRLAVAAGTFALLVGCEPAFYGDLGLIGFATNLGSWTPARPIARGAPLQVGVAEVGGKDEGWSGVESRVTGNLDGTALEDGALQIEGDRGRIWFSAVGQDGVQAEDHFGVRFEDPREALSNGEPRLAIPVGGPPCTLELTLHGRRGVRLGHDPKVVDVAGDGFDVWSTPGEAVEVAFPRRAVGRLEVSYGDFGAIPGPELVGVTLDEVARVELQAIPLTGSDEPMSALVPIGYTADETPVACVPVTWDIAPELGIAQEPDENGRVWGVLAPGRRVPDGVAVHLDR